MSFAIAISLDGVFASESSQQCAASETLASCDPAPAERAVQHPSWNWTRTILLVILLFASLSALATAQQLYDGNQNLPPFGSFSGSKLDIVSLQNGNLHIAIPLLTVKQRGRNDLTVKFIYDTPAYTAVWIPQPQPMNPKAGTWQYQGGFDYVGWCVGSA